MMDGKAASNSKVFNHNMLLLEATGDSESDCNPIMDHEHAFGGDDDDDDAQSCIYDEPDTGDPFELNGWDEDEKKKKKKGMLYGITSYCEDDGMQEQHHHHNKSSVSDDDDDDGDSGLDESEKNRLFWEACLAS